MKYQNPTVRQHLREQGGGVLVWFTLLIAVPFIVFTAFTLDIGLSHFSERNMQFATDSAAMNAGLAAINGGSEADSRAAAVSAGVANGLSEGNDPAQNDFRQDTDIEFGRWDPSDTNGDGDRFEALTFNDANTDSVRVSARRQVRTQFARALGTMILNPGVSSVVQFQNTFLPRCVTPFGVETLNFPEDLGVGNQPVDFIFEAPLYPGGYSITVGKESPGNWGKIDVPDSNGDPINMSSNPNFCWGMLQEECHLPQGENFDPCFPPIADTDGQFGEEFDGATGGAGVKDVFEALLGREIVMLVNSPFGNGKKPVDVYGYAIGTVDKVTGSGANMQLDLNITELTTTVPDDPNRSIRSVNYVE